MIFSSASSSALLRSAALLLASCGLAWAAVAAPPKVYRDRVEPNWLGQKGREAEWFWYRNDLAGGTREFVLVDAERGVRAPAFDHAKVAAALAKELGKDVAADSLPIESLKFPEGRDGPLVLLGRTRSWTLDRATHTLKAGSEKDSSAPGLRPRREAVSRAPGQATTVTFLNERAEAVEVLWVRDDGSRQSYFTLEPGAEREQNTYSGHAWIVQRKGGEFIAAYVAEDAPGLAVVREQIDFGRGGRERRGEPRSEAANVGRSPDGRWQVLVRGDNLFLKATGGTEARQLTHDGHRDDSYARNVEAARGMEMEYDARAPENAEPEVYWAPDSSRFVAMRHTPGARRTITMVESSPPGQLQPRLHTIPYLKPGDAVPYAKPHLFSVAEAREIPVDDSLFKNPWSIGDVRWAADSSSFTFLFNQRGHQVLRILSVDTASGAVRPVVEEVSRTFISYSGKFFAEYLDATGEILWMSERDGWNHLYLYDAKTGAVKNQVTKGEWVVRGVDRVDAQSRQVWFRGSGRNPGEDPYHVHYYRVNFDGTGLVALTEGDGNHRLRNSPDNRYLLDTWSRADQAPVNELRRASDGRLLCVLEKSDTSELGRSGWKAPVRFTAKGRDGVTDIYGLINFPTHYDPTKRYPVLEDIYAGPHDSFVPKEFRIGGRNQALLDAGFFIVRIDGMGTSNRSKAFHDVAWKNLADSGFPDRILWIKAAAAKYPAMDLGRVGLYGTSAGGQSALRGLLDHGDFYKAGVADCGCHDNRMDKIWWNEQWLGWPVDESYVKSSNVEDAHKLTGKLLLMVGELDKNVDPASTMQVANALIRANKDYDLLVVPGGGHGSVSTPYGARRLLEFFQKAFLSQNAP